MKNNKAFLYFYTTLLIISTACRSQAQSTPSPTTTIQDIPTIAASPTAAAVPSGPMSLMQLYDAHVRAGQWTEGEGLATLLGTYTGTTQSDALGNSSVDDFELTGLLRIADQFLQNNPNDPKHDEVQKQVNLLVAPADQLERFSRKHSLSSATVQLVSLRLSPPLDTGDSATCQHLWADGFSDPNPVICFEYDEDVVDGTRVRLYYPSWWAADDPRRSRLTPIFEAASRAIHTYNAYGPNPLAPVTLVVTDLAGMDPDTHRRNSDLHALAIRGRTAAPSCYVGVFPSLFDLLADRSQQALAHEMFHCYQYQNLAAQEAGPARSANNWWVEGSAEYFSNVVYPSVNLEHRFLGQLPDTMHEHSLNDWGYQSFIFFQYLENRSDTRTPGVLNLLRAMPTSGGRAEQLAALSSYPNMNVIFHEFVQAVADQNVIDSSGAAIPLPVPYYPDIVTEVTPGNIFGTAPFMLDIRRVIFPVNFDYNVTTRITGSPGQTSARLESAPRTWGSVPTQVDAGCSEQRYIVVESQTAPTETDSGYEVFVRATSTPNTNQCSCLTGTWLLDNSTYLTHLNGIIEQSAPGSLTYTGVEGSDRVTFTGDGHMTQTVDHMLINGDSSAANVSIQVAMDGSSNASYTAVEGRLSFTGYEANLTIATYLNNQAVSAPTNELASGPLGTAATYVCSENTLTLTPIYPTYSDLPALTFTRQSP